MVYHLHPSKAFTIARSMFRPVIGTRIDKSAMNGLVSAMRCPALALGLLLCACASAAALVGGAREIPNATSRPEVMLTGSRGSFCSGVAIARDLVLTAAHCVQ